MMKVINKERIRMACGTKVYKVEGINLNEKELEEMFKWDAPFGFRCRIYDNNTLAECTCYYD